MTLLTVALIFPSGSECTGTGVCTQRGQEVHSQKKMQLSWHKRKSEVMRDQQVLDNSTNIIGNLYMENNKKAIADNMSLHHRKNVHRRQTTHAFPVWSHNGAHCACASGILTILRYVQVLNYMYTFIAAQKSHTYRRKVRKGSSSI